VTVVIAAYQPGDAVNRVVESLDAQTLPQSEFEVIFVDDGSADDTFERLQRVAAARPNVQVHRIPNSGWPSRPRNVGIEHARGEYVLFMDHDDSLYPDGLRRAYEYAAANDADVLSPKESKTNDVWWGMSSLTDGNIPNVMSERGIERVLPMVPHKLYRRAMLIDNDIHFPEGSRVLWEDWFINLDAYRHAEVISVLADTPVYLWHASDTNSSHTFSPTRLDFWDRLEEMMDYIAHALADPRHEAALISTMTHQIRTRVVDRCVRLAARTDREALETKHQAFQRARRLIERFTSDAVFEQLPRKHQLQVLLMARGDLDLVASLHASDLAMQGRVEAGGARWGDGVLHYDLLTRWEPKHPTRPALKHVGDRTVLALAPQVERALPADMIDVSGDADELVTDLCIRSRSEYVTWALPASLGTPRFARTEAGALCLQQAGHGRIRLADAALGRALEDTVWDVRVRTEWLGMERRGPLLYSGPVLPALVHGRARVAYANAARGLSLDLAQRLRTFAIDARPARGPAGPVSGFVVELLNIATFGDGTLGAETLIAIPDGAVVAEASAEDEQARLRKLGAGGALDAQVVVGADGARLRGSVALGAGRYTIFAEREGRWHRTRRAVHVTGEGQLEWD
jgi:hypothetical protein